MIPIKINNFEVLVKSNISFLEACDYIGITIPRFCYHEILSIAGNCRMCLIELENSEKPIASCVTLVGQNLSIFTNSPAVKKARENVVESLLINHPLDCPICDQAGECDLQDQARNFGSNFSRFQFKKRSVEDKNCGPFIKTIMTRCIHCTRCVRFCN
jgi:NADH-quinone oxidoreductase subunit G